MEAQLEYTVGTLHTHFCTFGTDLYAQSVIINKISASELSGSVLLVGKANLSTTVDRDVKW